MDSKGSAFSGGRGDKASRLAIAVALAGVVLAAIAAAVPLLMPAIVSGWVFVALHAVRETTMALMLYSPSSRVISLLMWDTWQSGDVGRASATGVVLMICTALIILAGRYVDQRRARRFAKS